MKEITKPCEYCHRLPLHAGGCKPTCIIGGWIGRTISAIVMLEHSLDAMKTLSESLNKLKKEKLEDYQTSKIH